MNVAVGEVRTHRVKRIDWDGWRADYDHMSFAEHQAFNAMAADAHPVQQSFDYWEVHETFHCGAHGNIVELGGWDGALAAQILERWDDNITSWVNYDITPNVQQVCAHKAYSRVVLEDWPWNMDVSGDLLIASHVLEHMRMSEVEALFSRWDVKAAHIDVPILPFARSWDGYEGTHILEVGSTEFLARLAQLGWKANHVVQRGEGMLAFLVRA